MNNLRRKKVKQAIKMLNEAQKIIEEIASEEEESLDNIPDSLQDSEMAEKLNENIFDLDEADSSLADAIISLENVIE